MPQCVECLTNLKYLGLNGCGQKKFPCEILSELSQLQDLIIEEYWDGMFAPITVKEKVECLRKLELWNVISKFTLTLWSFVTGPKN